MLLIFERRMLSVEKDLLVTEAIFKSGSNALKICLFKSSRPLKTERTTTIAIVPKHTPTMEMIEMKLMKLLFFFEKKYFLAIKKGTFIRN